MASPSAKLQHSNTLILPINTLDGGLRLLMLRRFSRPNRAARGPLDLAQTRECVSFELDSAANK